MGMMTDAGSLIQSPRRALICGIPFLSHGAVTFQAVNNNNELNIAETCLLSKYNSCHKQNVTLFFVSDGPFTIFQESDFPQPLNMRTTRFLLSPMS